MLQCKNETFYKDNRIVQWFTVHVPYAGDEPIRYLYKGNRLVYNGYDLENLAVRDYIHKNTYTKQLCFEGNYNVIGTKIKRTFLEKYISLANQNISQGNAHGNKYPSWTERPMPIMINATGGTSVRVSTSPDFSTYLTYTANGRTTCIYNLIPKTRYYYRVMSSSGDIIDDGVFVTQGQERMIALSVLRNVRDIGGWPCYDSSGNVIGHIAYGKIIRGRAFNDSDITESAKRTADINELKNHVGVNVQLDLRASGYATSAISGIELLSGATYGFSDTNTSATSFYQMATTNSTLLGKVGKCLAIIATRLEQGKTIYVHCTYGMDRTGLLCAILQMICGCSYDEVTKDWELSSLSESGAFDDVAYTYHRIDVKRQFQAVLEFLDANYGQNGETLQQQCIAWLKAYSSYTKVTDALIERLQSVLIAR